MQFRFPVFCFTSSSFPPSPEISLSHHSKEDPGSHSDWPSLRYLFMDQGLAGEGREDADWLSLSESDLIRPTGGISVPLQYMVGVKKG